MKQRIKGVFTRNIGWKILSIIAAGLFWLIVVNIIDPTVKRTFEDIPVEVLNETAITSSNQVYEIVSGETVDVTITSKRSLVERLKPKDFVATADLADLSSVNAVNIQVKLKKNPNNLPYELNWNNAVLRVKLEDRVTKKFKVDVMQEGELAEGYVLGDVKVKPNIIEVAGGESKMRRIDHVSVTVPLKGQTEEFSIQLKPFAYDSSGEIIDATNLSFSETEVKVTVGVRITMDVPVEVTTEGVPAEGYHLIQTDRQPESVRVSVDDPEKLNEDLVIRLKVNIEGATADVEKEINIANYLGRGYIIEDDVTVISVRCEIGKSGSRSLTLTGSDIEVRNPPDGHSVEFTDPDERYEVKLTGSDEKLKNVQLKDLGAYIDIGPYKDGVHKVTVNFTLPDGLTLSAPVTVEISITKIEGEATPTPEPEETPDEGEEEE
ncbi:MAG: CdaR family protein [Eubacterium sp.]|nr:CdaR family protein [Eubacterium sp.]